MAWWIYKCNNKKKWHGNTYKGDWRKFFSWGKKPETWGLLSKIPQLQKLHPGDSVFAYQTERNELVGLLTMVKFDGDEVRLKVVEELGVTVRPLKDADQRIAAIAALQQGPKQTLRSLSAKEGKLLLSESRAARKAKTLSVQ